MISSNWKIYIGLILVALSAAMGVAHYAIFGDARTLLFYLALDVVFVPVQVLFVTLIIEQMLSKREQQAMLNKLNMVIGTFYSEVGSELLRQFRRLSSDSSQLDGNLKITKEWTSDHYKAAISSARGFRCEFEFKSPELAPLKELLVSKRSFMLGLLQNPNLLEHERFTDLLWAVLHLTEELTARIDIDNLPAADLEHIYGDINRAFGHLICEWLAYMRHLKTEYPYLYSLATRTNPFNPDASAIIYK